MDDAAFDPTRRKLCTDGSCVGVIGDDGLCRVCSRTEAQAAAGTPVDVEPPSALEAGGAGEGGEIVEVGVSDGGFDSKRRLCSDGACVGVVGEDGVCRVCGRRSE